MVDPAADEGQPCAANAALDGALRQRLPGVRVESAVAATGADLRAVLRGDADGWVLELFRSDGELALRRRLQYQAGQCALAADTAALVVDRFLEEIRWSGRPASIAPLPRPPPPEPPKVVLPDPPPPLPPPAPVAPAPPVPIAPAPAPLAVEAPPRVVVSVGPAAWLGVPNDLRAALLAEAMARLGGAYEAGLLAIGALPTRSDVKVAGASRGTFRVQTGLLAAAGSACAERWSVRFCSGPLLGVRAASGSSEGQLFQKASATMVHPEVGVRAAAEVRFGTRWTAGVEALGAAALGRGTFNVAGADAAREVPRVDLALAVRVGVGAL